MSRSYVMIMFLWTKNFNVYSLSPCLPRYDALKLNKQWCGLFGLRQASWHGCACTLFGFSSLWLATVNRSDPWQCWWGAGQGFLSGREVRLGYCQGCQARTNFNTDRLFDEVTVYHTKTIYLSTPLFSVSVFESSLSIWLIHTCT